MDLEKILLKLRAIAGVESSDLDAIAEYIADQNKSINKLKVDALEKEKATKKQAKIESFKAAIAKLGYDQAAFVAFLESNLIDLNKLSFDAAGTILVGDRAMEDFLDSAPYLKKALQTNQKVEDAASRSGRSDEVTIPAMGTTNNGTQDQNPLDTLVKEGLFAVPST